MAELPPGAAEIVVEVERITAQPGKVTDQVRELLTVLHRLVPYTGSMLCLLNPERRQFELLDRSGYNENILAYMGSSGFYRELELLGMNRDRPPMCLRDAPIPAAELPSWAEFLGPAGFREGVGVPLFSSEGRHLGLLCLHTDDPAYPSDEARDFLGLLAPLISDVVDPMHSIVALSRIVTNAQAGAVLTRSGGVLSLPGMPEHPLLRRGSAVLDVATLSLAEENGHVAFLCPCRPSDGSEGYVRVTVLPCPASVPAHLLGMVLISASGDLRGLTRRELEILGLLVNGWPNQRMATGLVITQRTVAAHIEHILAKLNAPSRTLAAVRALRLGLYVPWPLVRTRQ